MIFFCIYDGDQYHIAGTRNVNSGSDSGYIVLVWPAARCESCTDASRNTLKLTCSGYVARIVYFYRQGKR